MGAAVERFRVAPDELDRVVSEVAASERTLETVVGELRTELGRMRTEWHGIAATAQAEAQAEWERGFAGMREALHHLRAAARTAHANYTGAATTNASMWAATR